MKTTTDTCIKEVQRSLEEGVLSLPIHKVAHHGADLIDQGWVYLGTWINKNKNFTRLRV